MLHFHMSRIKKWKQGKELLEKDAVRFAHHLISAGLIASKLTGQKLKAPVVQKEW